MGNPTESLPMEIRLSQASGMRRWNQLQKIVELLTKVVFRVSQISHLNSQMVQHSRNFRVDDIVICKDMPTQQPGRWPLARVTDSHPGPDGRLRVVTVCPQYLKAIVQDLLASCTPLSELNSYQGECFGLPQTGTKTLFSDFPYLATCNRRCSLCQWYLNCILVTMFSC